MKFNFYNFLSKYLLVIAVFVFFIPLNSWSQTTYVPDDNFENYLEANGMGDGIPLNDYVLTSNINTVTNLTVSSLSISDLTGIEDFAALSVLDAQGNGSLTSVDLSQNSLLSDARFNSCNLGSLDLSNNTQLTILTCGGNNLTALDVSNNALLTTLDCWSNSISILDLSQNTALTSINCNSNQISSLDFSNSPNMTSISCNSNQLTSLDVTNLAALQILWCPGNSISVLDLSQNSQLNTIRCENNTLHRLDVKNGNNINVTQFFTTGNPSLECINVDDSTYSANNWTNIDSQQYFGESCYCSLIINSQTNVSCYGGYDGSLILTGTGGTGYYNYVLGFLNQFTGTLIPFTNTGTGFYATPINLTNVPANCYTATITDSLGCADTTTICVTQPDSIYSITTMTQCNQVIWNFNTYNSSGIYNAVLTAANGCDSSAILDVTLIFSDSSFSTINSCDSYIWNGTTYTSSGIYTNISPGSNGCDSVATLYLTINNSSTSSFTIISCDSYVWDGVTYTSTGNYTNVYTAANGCDSTVTLDLTINNSSTNTITINSCDSYVWDGVTYSTTGNYTNVYTSSNGCDSTVVLNLTINSSSTNTVSVTACDSYDWDGVTYTSTGNYINVYSGLSGCDSTVTLDLTINNSSINTLTINSCDSYIWDGTSYTTSGQYTNVYTALNGCDSSVTLDLTLTYSDTSFINTTACDSFTLNNITYNQSGIYYQTISADSLTGFNYVGTYNGSTYYISENPEYWAVAQSNCIANGGNLVCISDANENDFVSNILPGQQFWLGYTDELVEGSFVWVDGSNHTYTKWSPTEPSNSGPTGNEDYTLINSGEGGSNPLDGFWNDVDDNLSQYLYVLELPYSHLTSYGCDSVIALNLTINVSDTSYTNITACDSIEWNGEWYDSSGTFYSVSNNLSSNSLIFDGSSYVSISDDPSLNWGFNNFSVSVWVNKNNSSPWLQTIISKMETTSGNYVGWNLGLVYNQIRFTPGAGTVNGNWVNNGTINSNFTLNDNQWYYITGVFDGINSQTHLYVDGILIASETANYTINPNNSQDLKIGAYMPSGAPSGPEFFYGNIDNVEIWNRALDISEIQNYMSCSPTGSEQNLLGLWNFEEGSGNTVYDQTSNGNDGTINGASYDTNVPIQSCQLTNINGCDSVAVLNLTINQSDTSYTNITACDSVEWNGEWYDSSGTFYHSTSNLNNQSSLDFSSSFSHVTIPNSPELNPAELTISFWTKLDAYGGLGQSGYNHFVNKKNASTNQYHLSANTTGIYAYIGNNLQQSNVLPQLNVWEHVAFTYSSLGLGKMYLNGTLIHSFTDAPMIPSSIPLNIGGNSFSPYSYTSVHGKMDDVQLWQRVLTQNEIQQYMSCLPDANESDLVGLWNFEEGSGSTVFDQSSYSNDGTINGATYATNTPTNSCQLTTNNGCDSVAVLNLTINNSSSNTVTVTACDSYAWDGVTYTTSGQYINLYADINGCDSTVTLDLIINNSSTNTVTIISCDSYDWDGVTYTSTGQYTNLYTDINGCDSTVTLDLIINNSSTNTVTIISCDSYDWDGVTYTSTGQYTNLYTDINGCDSITVLSLTINNSINIYDTTTICNGDSVIVGGSTYTSSGNYIDTLTTNSGCDSIINTVLNINYIDISQSDSVICLGDSTVLSVNGISLQLADLTVPNGQIIYTDDIRSSVISNNLSSSNTLNISNSLGFQAGDKVLIITMQDSLLYGNYEFNRILSVQPTSLLLESGLQNSYISTSLSKHQVLKVPEYNNVVVDGVLTCHPWDGNTGGVLCFDSYSDVTVNSNGSINADTYGYRGGDNVIGWGGGNQGESFTGIGQSNYLANSSGGGGGNAEWCHSGQGGGGAGYFNQGSTAPSPCFSCGGGWSFGSCTNSGFGGDLTLNYQTKLIPGSGGGSGGVDGDNPDGGGYGGNGGGIIFINADEIKGNGNISANGSNGHDSPGETGGGGGGSGGLVSLNVNNTSIIPLATAGLGGKLTDSRKGGNGSDGYVVINNPTINFITYGDLIWSNGDTTAQITVSPNQTTTYWVTQTLNGVSCTDSVIVYVNQPSFSSSNITACDSYIWDSVTYTSSGQYVNIYTASNGCDSTVTLDLTINNSSTNTVTIISCDSYDWDGVTYTTTGQYTNLYTDANGCDSTVTLDLTINNSSTSSFAITACDSFDWDGVTYATTGLYTNIYSDVNGCDSTVTLDLTVNNSSTNTVTVTSCDSYDWDGVTYTTNGQYTNLYSDINGCDSIAILSLTINNSVNVYDTTTICNGDSVIVGTSTYTSSGNYIDTLITNTGCDSIINTNIIVNNIDIIQNDTTICYGDSVSLGVSGGTVNFQQACSLNELPINLQNGLVAYYPFCGNANDISNNSNHGNTNGTTLTQDRFGNSNYAYDFDGSSHINVPHNSSLNFGLGSYTLSCWINCTGSNTYQHAITKLDYQSSSIKSTIFLRYENNTIRFSSSANLTTKFNLISNPTSKNVWKHLAAVYNSLNDSVYIYIDGVIDKVSAANNIVNADNNDDLLFGVEHATISLPSGPQYLTGKLDDIGIWNRTLTSQEIQELYSTSLSPEILWSTGDTTSNITVSPSQTTTYYVSQTLNGITCYDSLTVTVNPVDSLFFSISSCDSYAWDGVTYTVSGHYTNLYVNVNGCDSTVTLDLTINNSSSNSVAVTACDSYTWDGVTYTSTGLYTNVYSDVNGCDSTVILDLLINNSSNSSFNITACDSYDWDGVTYTLTGLYTNVYVAVNGCDSIVTLDLTINNSSSNTVAVTACDSYDWDGVTYTTSGQYTNLYTDINGCDSTVTLDLTINNSFTSSFNITACDSYDWDSVTYTSTGLYTNIYTGLNGCDSAVTLFLNIINSTVNYLTVTECDSYTWDGVTYTSTGLYSNTYTALNGCDSIVTLDLIIISSPVIVQNDTTICYGDSITLETDLSSQISNSQDVCLLSEISSNLQNDLVAYYPFCGNANDISLNSNNGNVIGANLSTNRFGDSLNSYVFDGVGDYIELVNSTSFSSLDSNISISSWIYPENYNDGTIIDRDICGNSPDWHLSWRGNGNAARVLLRVNNQSLYSGNYNSNQWLHIVAVKNNTNFELYINNQFQGSVPVPINLINTSLPIYIGDQVCNSSSEPNFDGRIDDVGVWSRALDSSEVNQLYNSNFPQYVWSTGDSAATITIVPTQTTIYILEKIDNGISCFDSVTVTVNDTSSSFSQAVSCDNYTWNGITYSTSGLYSFTSTNYVGCDSIAFLDLTINNEYDIIDSIGICPGDSVLITGNYYSTLGTYVDSFFTNSGCDSIVTTVLSYLPIGCTDSTSFNYDPLAQCDDNSCIMAIYGCLDSNAINYYPSANFDDGSCIYLGCTDSTASNYNPAASIDDGTCVYAFCSDPVPFGFFTNDITDTKARINWNNMNDSACMVWKYFVRYREVGTNTWTTKSAGVGSGLCNVGLNTTSKFLQNLNPSTTYEYKMKAFYCGGTESSYSSPVQFTTEDLCPEMTNLSAQTFYFNPNKVRFNWDTTGLYTFARIVLRVDSIGSSWQGAGGYGIYYPNLSVNKYGMQPGEFYRAQGRTFCDSNITSYRSWWTPPIFWQQPGSSRLNGGNTISNLDVYPNPSRDIFNITFVSEELQNLKLRILNILGEEIYVEEKEQYIGEYTKQINLNEYRKGVYFLEIETNNGVINKKLILQ